MADRLLKVSLGGEVMRLTCCIQNHDNASSLQSIRSTIMRGFNLTLSDPGQLVLRYEDGDRDKCLLTCDTVRDCLQQFQLDPVRLLAEVKPIDENRLAQRCSDHEDLVSYSAHKSESQGYRSIPARRDQEVAAISASQLASLGSMAFSEDETVRRSATDAMCTALVKDRSSTAVTTALQLLTASRDEHVRRKSVEALCDAATAGNRGALGFLRSLVTSSDEHVRHKSAAALSAAARACSDEHVRHKSATCSDLVLAINDVSGSVVRDVCIKRQRENDDACMETQDVTKRIAKLRAEGIEGKADAIHSLLELSQDRTQRVRRSASEAILAACAAECEFAVRELPSLAQHHDEHIRRTSAWALVARAVSGHLSVISALEPLTRSSDEEIRRGVVSALCSYSLSREPCVSAILDQLVLHSDEHIRRIAGSALCRSK